MTHEIWNATVVGHDEFPTDTLTRDRCWPRTNYDEDAIGRSHEDAREAAKQRWLSRTEYPYVREHARERRYVVNLRGVGNGPAFHVWEARGYTFQNVEYTTN